MDMLTYLEVKKVVDNQNNTVIREFTAGENLSKGNIVTGVRGKLYKNIPFTDTTTFIVSAGNNVRNQPVLVKLDNTHFMAIYSDNANNGYAVIITVSGTSKSCGTAFEFNSSGNSTYISAVAIDSTHVLVCFSANAFILTVNGTTITAGTLISYTVQSGVTFSGVALIDATHVIVRYSSGYNGWIQVLTISGTTITTNTELNYTTTYGGSNNPDTIAVLDSAHAILGSSNSSAAAVFLIGISGTTLSVLTMSSTFTIDTIDGAPKINKIDSTHVIILFNNSSQKLREVLITGDTVTLGPILNNVHGINIAIIDSNHFFCLYSNGNSIYAYSYATDANLNVIYSNIDYLIYGSSATIISARALPIDDTHWLVMYYANNQLYAIIVRIFDYDLNDYGSNLGIVLADVAKGYTTKVLISGKCDGYLSGLTPGDLYYNANGNLVADDYCSDDKDITYTLSYGGSSSNSQQKTLYAKHAPYAVALSETEIEILQPLNRYGCISTNGITG